MSTCGKCNPPVEIPAGGFAKHWDAYHAGDLPPSKLGTATNRGECRSCRAPVVWIRTFKNDKPMPVNADDPDTSHFATCEQAPAWRKS